MTERLQLNLRLDGRDDLLEAIRVAAVSQGLSVNAFIVKALEGAVGIESTTAGKKKQPTTPAATKPLIPEVLDKLLDKPVELSSTKPLDTKPLDTKPLDTKPLDIKPLDKLQAENEALKQELVAAKGLTSGGHFWQEIDRQKERNRQLRIKITANNQENLEKTRDLEDMLQASQSKIARLQSKFDELQTTIGNLRAENEVLRQLKALRTDRPETQESVPVAADFPEPANLLNKLRSRRKKSKADLADIAEILEILSH